jgi:hypothetical protein
VGTLPRQVIYVGEAKDLNERPLTSHPYAQRYAELFGDPRLLRLYVAVAPLYRTDEEHDAYRVERLFAAYWEAKLVWRYAEKHHHPPVLHFEKDKPEAEWVARAVAAFKGPQGLTANLTAKRADWGGFAPSRDSNT